MMCVELLTAKEVPTQSVLEGYYFHYYSPSQEQIEEVTLAMFVAKKWVDNLDREGSIILRKLTAKH